jgi:HEPN domain-containing protein
VTNSDLSVDYIIRAGYRLEALEILFNKGSYPDIITKSQEILELTLKGYLRYLKIDPPKWHDVGSILSENRNLLDTTVQSELELILDLSKYLRKERENAFYGDDDLIPLSSYSKQEALEVKNRTQKIYSIIKILVLKK